MNVYTVDDLDDTEITAEQATTVAWSWRGVDYEFDTAAERLAGIESGDRAITVIDEGRYVCLRCTPRRAAADLAPGSALRPGRRPRGRLDAGRTCSHRIPFEGEP
ncbi:Lsr2 dimerization domain-containing protein [Williamsia deligens]|uniref:Lsr2 dimerization domain-containing protein n=1 Tax=Williamsia deligens TaxID=321325 RepID=A0ABW3G6X4_9NOCA|nr:hypothetical protein [Williamsia deligens]